MCVEKIVCNGAWLVVPTAMQAKCQYIPLVEAMSSSSISAKDSRAPRLPDLRKQWAALQNLQLQGLQGARSHTLLSFDFWLASKKSFLVINGR